MSYAQAYDHAHPSNYDEFVILSKVVFSTQIAAGSVSERERETDIVF